MITDKVNWVELESGKMRAFGMDEHEKVPLMTVEFHNQFSHRFLTKKIKNDLMGQFVLIAIDRYWQEIVKEANAKVGDDSME